MVGQFQTPKVIHHALFEALDDSDKGSSFRWSPGDARHYARRWNDPGSEGSWTSWGANYLAFESLPMFSTQPIGKHLKTTGFRRPKGKVEFTWPMWETPLGMDELRSVLTWRILHDETVDPEKTRAVGIAQVFRSARVHIGNGAHFKVSFLPSKAV